MVFEANSELSQMTIIAMPERSLFFRFSAKVKISSFAVLASIYLLPVIVTTPGMEIRALENLSGNSSAKIIVYARIRFTSPAAANTTLEPAFNPSPL